MPYSNGTIFGRFVTEKRLHTSRMSEVYLAYDEDKYAQHGKKYRATIKVNLPDDHAANLQALQKEVNFLKNIHHPSIVRVFPLREYKEKMHYILFESAQICYYAMEYLEGGSLETQLSFIHSYRFDFLWRMELFFQILSAVHYLHQLGYAHLDLKPENILFRYPLEPQQVPIPVLIDFGSASFVDSLHGDVTITRRYAAPELLEVVDRPDFADARQRVIPDRADVWSLGALMFEILTHQPLVPGRTDKQLSTTIRERNFRTITDINPYVPHVLNKLLSTMIHENPMERLPTSNLLEALQEIIVDIQPPRISDVVK